MSTNRHSEAEGWHFFYSPHRIVFPTTQLAAGLRDWEVSEFIEDDEVEPHQMFRKPARPSCTGFGLQPVHQIDDIEEPAPGTIADEALAIRIDRKLNSTDVIDVLSDLFILRGVPEHVRSDHGPEFFATGLWLKMGDGT
ncbi:hypothetical protein PAYE108092_14315 [Paracoccus yeei]